MGPGGRAVAAMGRISVPVPTETRMEIAALGVHLRLPQWAIVSAAVHAMACRMLPEDPRDTP